MKRVDRSALFFDEEDVRKSTGFLPRLVRIVFYALGITNEEYGRRYERYIRENNGVANRVINHLQISANRKSLNESDRHDKSLTFKLFNTVINAMGYDIECVSVRMRDRVTDEVFTFSTDMTSDDLKVFSEKEKEIGVKSFIE